MLKLNLGCGRHRLTGWQNFDREVDLAAPATWPWAENTVDCILLEHCLEHIDPRSGYLALEQCYKVLRPGGVIRVCFPDVLKLGSARLDPAYRDFIIQKSGLSSPVKATLCGFEHKMAWTPGVLAVVLRDIGYRKIHPERPRQSDHPDLRNVEGHHKRVGVRMNDAETSVIEAEKQEPTTEAQRTQGF